MSLFNHSGNAIFSPLYGLNAEVRSPLIVRLQELMFDSSIFFPVFFERNFSMNRIVEVMSQTSELTHPPRDQGDYDTALSVAKAVVGAVSLPVTIDFEGAYAVEPEGVAANVRRLAETGAIGCNFEDQVIGGTGVHPLGLQVRRIAAIRQARRAIDELGKRGEISLVYAGGIRNGGDVAKAMALGADAVAIGHSVLMALNCNKEIPESDFEAEIGVPAGYCYHCHTGRCPVGITTQDPELRKRLNVEEAATRVYNFLHTLTLEVQMLARACGKTNIHSLEPEDLCALTVEAAAMAKVPLTGTDYIPGVSEERALGRIERLLERPSFARALAGARPYFDMFPFRDDMPARFLDGDPVDG